MTHLKVAHLLAFFTLTVFLVIPGTLYIFNFFEWNFDHWLVLYFVFFGSIAFIILFIFYFILSKFSNYFSIVYVYIFFTLGIIILLNDFLSPVQIGLLDGSRIYSSEPLINTLVEFAIILLAIYLVWYLVKTKKSLFRFIIGPLYFVSSIIIISIFIINYSYKPFDSKKLNSVKSESHKSLPNIYHLHIDGMQTDYFLRYINNNPEIKNKLSGFTLFEKNISNYPSTMLSLPSYLTSTTHLEGRFDKWLKSYDQGLLKELRNNGYKLIHSSNAPYRSKYFHEIIAIPELLKRYSGARHLPIVEFTRVWLAKISPNFLTNESLPVGKKLGKKIFYILNPDQDGDIALTMEDGTSALSGILLFKDLINDISYYSRENQYVFMLNSILHDGYVSSPECKLEKTDFPIGKRYYRQLECTMNLIGQFISELKKRGKYDDSLIIIHGDHGSHFVGQLDKIEGNSFRANMNSNDLPYDESISSYPLSLIESKARALLMIKPLSGFGDLKISYNQTQLLDIYPTIIGQLNQNKLDDVEGLDIYKDNLNSRPRYFYYMMGNRFDTQIDNFLIMKPVYDKESGRLSLVLESKGRTTFYSFFKNGKNIKKYKDIKFYYSNIKGRIVKDIEWVFLDGMDQFNNWGAWTNSKKVTIGFIPEDAISRDYKKVSIKIANVFLNNKNSKISSKFYLNKKLIGSLDFTEPINQYSFPKILEFPISENIIIQGSPNIFEIHIENSNFERSSPKGKNDKFFGLGLVELSLR